MVKSQKKIEQIIFELESKIESHRNRTVELEKKINETTEIENSYNKKIDKIRSEIRPLKEQLEKVISRCNDFEVQFSLSTDPHIDEEEIIFKLCSDICEKNQTIYQLYHFLSDDKIYFEEITDKFDEDYDDSEMFDRNEISIENFDKYFPKSVVDEVFQSVINYASDSEYDSRRCYVIGKKGLRYKLRSLEEDPSTELLSDLKAISEEEFDFRYKMTRKSLESEKKKRNTEFEKKAYNPIIKKFQKEKTKLEETIKEKYKELISIEKETNRIVAKKQIKANYSEKKDQIKEEINLFSQFKEYYKNTINNQNKISIQKNKNERGSILDDKQTYSLWLRDEPVMLFLDGKLHYLHSTRKNAPLQISSRTPSQYQLEDIMKAKENLDFEDGDFITYFGNVLIGNDKEFAKELFHKVMIGKEILPSKEGLSFVEKPNPNERNGNGHEIKYRNWSQMYLSDANPDRVEQGQVLGGGGSYKAFIYDDIAIVEYDKEKRATYIFKKDNFNELRNWTRKDILEQKPEGFIDRLNHGKTEDHETWKNNINSYIDKE